MLVSNYMQSKLVWKRMDTIENSVQRVETKIWWYAHTEAREMTTWGDPKKNKIFS